MEGEIIYLFGCPRVKRADQGLYMGLLPFCLSWVRLRVGVATGGFITIACSLGMNRNRRHRLVRETATRAPLGFVFNANTVLPTFRSTLGKLRMNSGFGFSVAPTSTCNRCIRRRMLSLPGGVFRMSNGFSSRVVGRNGAMPVVSSGNGHVGNSILRMGRSIIIVSFGRPLTNRALRFGNRIVSMRRPATRRVTTLATPTNKYNYKYSSYKDNYNSRGRRDKYKYNKYRWEVSG